MADIGCGDGPGDAGAILRGARAAKEYSAKSRSGVESLTTGREMPESPRMPATGWVCRARRMWRRRRERRMCWMIETAAHRSETRAKIEMVKRIRMSLGKNNKAGPACCDYPDREEKLRARSAGREL